jgi:hypothetical protein
VCTQLVAHVGAAPTLSDRESEVLLLDECAMVAMEGLAPTLYRRLKRRASALGYMAVGSIEETTCLSFFAFSFRPALRFLSGQLLGLVSSRVVFGPLWR